MSPDVVTYFLSSSFMLLLFLPGILLLNLISKRSKLPLSVPDIIILGSVLWNAVLILPSLLLGLSSIGVAWYFTVFTIASIAIVVSFSLHFLIENKKKTLTRIKIHIKLRPRYLWIPLLFIWLFVILVTIYSPIMLNWDAIIDYIPMAKALLLTNGFAYNPYMLSATTMTYPPLLPIVYAWCLLFTEGLYFRFLPIMFFLLTNLVIWQITKIIGQDGRISITAFSSMLSVQMLTSITGLYLDLAFIFYATVSIYIILRMFSAEPHRLWYLFVGLACVLNSLANEMGVIMTFLVLSFLIVFVARNMVGRLLFALVTAFPAIAIFGVMIRLQYSISELAAVFTVISILSFALFHLSTKLVKHTANVSRRPLLGGMIIFVIVCIPAAIFYLRNIFLLGVLTARMPLLQTSSLYNLGYVPSGTEGTNSISYFLWYRLFTAAGLGSPYIILVAVGFLLLLRRFSRSDRSSLIILSWFVAILLSWSIFFRCSYAVTEFRRLTYFAPIFSIAISIGAYAIYRRLGLGKYTLRLFGLTNSLVLLYIWIFRWNLGSFFGYDIFETTALDLLFFFFAFAVPILMLELVCPASRKPKNKRGELSKKIPALLLCSSLIVCSLPPVIMVGMVSLQTSQTTWDPGYYNSAGTMWVWNDLIAYYNSYVHDNYITVGFWNDPIIVFANRSYIDPGNYWGFTYLIPFLLCNKTDDLLAMLHSNNVRYFMIPNASVPSGGYGSRYRYEVLAQQYLLFRIITEDEHFVLLSQFRYFYLYKLL